jgi:hypothetical protein
MLQPAAQNEDAPEMAFPQIHHTPSSTICNGAPSRSKTRNKKAVPPKTACRTKGQNNENFVNSF